MKKSLIKIYLSVFLTLFSLGVSAQAVFAFEETEEDISREFGGDDTEEIDEFGEEADDFSDDSDTSESEEDHSLEISGFIEVEHGGHVGQVGVQNRNTVMENQRIQLKTSGDSKFGKYYLKVDFANDGVEDQQQVKLQEARWVTSPLEWIDLSIGNQVSTWGVADMLYINDLFPKNWVANFLGRETETLKTSSNSLRVTSYFGMSSGIDLVYHPEFSPDITPTGCRFAVYDPNTDALIKNTDSCGENFSSLQALDQYKQGELASRWFYKTGSHEIAFYTYSGYFKNPKGLQWVDSNGEATQNTQYNQQLGYQSRMAYYPKLHVYGISAEGQMGAGIYSFESGYYNSMEDQDGDNPMIENSFWKVLAGYRLDFSASLTVGVQWYAEVMEKYSAYEDGLINMLVAGGATAASAKEQDTYKYRKEKIQNTYTLRLTYKAMQERLWINFFGYQRPEDRDAFYKLDTKYQMDNNLYLIAGLNIFEGSKDYISREFGMLERDDNAFVRVKYTF